MNAHFAPREAASDTPEILPDDEPRPVPPPRPTSADCCRGGCEPCVFDLYEEAYERYEKALRAWLDRHKDPAPRKPEA